MPFFSSFTGSFKAGRRRPRGLGGGGAGAGGGGAYVSTFNADLMNVDAGVTAISAPFVHISPDGSTAVYAEAFYNNGTGLGEQWGRIHIFSSTSGSWEFVQSQLPPSSAQTNSYTYYRTYFGSGVAMNTDGSRIAVNGYNHGNTGSAATQYGAIWILDRQPDGTYSESYRISRPRSSNWDAERGISMTPDGNTISLATWNDGSSATDYVMADVYQYNSGTDSWDKMSGTTAFGKNVSLRSAGQNQYFGKGFTKISEDGNYCLFHAEEAWHFTSGGGYAAVGYWNGSNWATQRELNPSSPDGIRRYGASGDINSDGSVLAVSDTERGDINAGRVYIWRRSGSTWTQEQIINNPTTNANSYPRLFGTVVRMNSAGTSIAVLSIQSGEGETSKIHFYDYDAGTQTWGASSQGDIDTGFTDSFYGSSAWVDVVMDATSDLGLIILGDAARETLQFYERPGGGFGGSVSGGGVADFSVATDFTAAFASLADTSNTGNLGSKVSMSADKSTMIMHRHTDNTVATSAGAIEIFKNNNDGTWSYVEKFTVPSQTPGANGGYSSSSFGDGVALSADGSKIAVSGTGHGVNGASQNCGGAIWVLERQGDGTYAEFDRIDRPYSSNPNLGRAIDISADGTYIAASGSQLTNVSNIVYKLNSSTGEYEKMNSTTDGASNGVSVNWGSSSDLARGGHQNMVAAISDDGLYTVIGNQGSYEFGIDYGYAAVGFYNGSSWSVQQELRPANTSNPFGGKYGVSVDINEDGTVCVVGSTRHYNVGNSSRVGAFYVWRRTGTSWTEEQRVLGTSTNGFLGNNVRILPDGNTIFATAQQENGLSNKKILVYTYDSGSGSWSLAETIETNYTNTNFENEDQMDVSRDGSLVVVTAYGNTGTKALFFETAGGPYYTP